MSAEEFHVDCYMCGSSDKETVYAFPVYSLVRCLSCGHSFTDPWPASDRLLDFNLQNPAPYTRSSRRNIATLVKSKIAEIIGDYPKAGVLRWSRKIIPRRLLAVSVPFVAGGRILEVGPGAGELLDWLKDHGWNTWALDFSPRVTESLVARGHRAFTGDVEESKLDFLGVGSFDFIVLSNILEHLRDPVGVLSKIHPLLSDRGVLVACVPNIRSHASVVLGRSCTLLNIPRHLNFFSPDGLETILERAGYHVIRKQGKNAIGVLRGGLSRVRSAEGFGAAVGAAVRVLGGWLWHRQIDRADLITFWAEPKTGADTGPVVEMRKEARFPEKRMH